MTENRLNSFAIVSSLPQRLANVTNEEVIKRFLQKKNRRLNMLT